jgi:MoaA/NifB/PqqE/SkfB family radical SAM enzyme
VIFCLDGLEESNRKYRGTDFDTVISHIAAFSETGAWTHVQCILFKHNENEIEELKDRVKKAGANVFFTRYSRSFNNEFESPQKCQYDYDLDTYARNLDREPICALHNRNVLFIDVNGNALPCCFYAGEIIPHTVINSINIGVWKRTIQDNKNLNLFEHSLEEILETKLFKYIRNNYKTDIFCRTKCSVGREDTFEFFQL